MGSTRNYSGEFANWAFVMFWTILAGLGLYALYCTEMASGEIQFCYVKKIEYPEESSKPYGVYGSLEWAKDLEIARFSNIDEAFALIYKIKCPLNSTK